MKFYDRENELKILEKAVKGKGTRVIVIRGLRRIGKTRLVLESLKGVEHIRIFIPKDKTPESFLADIAKEHNIPVFTKLRDFLMYIFEKYEFVFLDEFQNFEYMDKSVFSDLQDLIDRYKTSDKGLCLLISGSSYSMIKKIFFDYAKALYGRKDFEIPVFEFDSPTVSTILKDIGIKNVEDAVKFWSIFGGVPKFYELLENMRIKSFGEFAEIFYIQNFKSLLEEGKSILVSELGGDYKTYFTAMDAIANSKTKISEIAVFFGNNVNSTNRYLDLLIKEYDLVRRSVPVIGRGSKIGTYFNKANFFDFWFNFVHKYHDDYDQGKFEIINENFKVNFNSYVGRKFEGFAEDFIKSGLVPFKFTDIGRQWGKIPNAPKGENEYEIDIVGLNDQAKEIFFCECKWSDLKEKEARQILEELKEKSKFMEWERKKEYFGLVGKKILGKEALRKEGFFVFDLEDFEKLK